MWSGHARAALNSGCLSPHEDQTRVSAHLLLFRFHGEIPGQNLAVLDRSLGGSRAGPWSALGRAGDLPGHRYWLWVHLRWARAGVEGGDPPPGSGSHELWRTRWAFCGLPRAQSRRTVGEGASVWGPAPWTAFGVRGDVVTPSEAGRTVGLGAQITGVAAPDLCLWTAEPFWGFTVFQGCGERRVHGACSRAQGAGALATLPQVGVCPSLGSPARCPRAFMLQEPGKDQRGPGQVSRTTPPG